ncbi:MAG: hypothetical protein BWY09_00688 [Candidatus Hydrogenedentes bacterium ADurb.Bin179]|nr:MAG: hypothetical protein BWY09_00688 [Candidatus Hydrogenedentes bacterium ADurb.Bin179]
MCKRCPTDEFDVVETVMAAQDKGHTDYPNIFPVIIGSLGAQGGFHGNFHPHRPCVYFHALVRNHDFLARNFTFAFSFSFTFTLTFGFRRYKLRWRGFAVASLVHAHRVEFILAVTAHARRVKLDRAHRAALRHKLAQRIAARGIRVPVECAETISTEIQFHVVQIIQSFRHLVRHRGKS